MYNFIFLYLEHKGKSAGDDSKLCANVHDVHPDADTFGAVAHPSLVELD